MFVRTSPKNPNELRSSTVIRKFDNIAQQRSHVNPKSIPSCGGEPLHDSPFSETTTNRKLELQKIEKIGADYLVHGLLQKHLWAVLAPACLELSKEHGALKRLKEQTWKRY